MDMKRIKLAFVYNVDDFYWRDGLWAAIEKIKKTKGWEVRKINLYNKTIAETDYIAIAEDDCLYHKNHFEFYRPDKDVFAYDQNRFALFTWGEPMYSWRNRRSNCSLIAPRELMIEALEERFKRHPNPIPDKIVGELGRGMVERNMRVTERKSTDQFAEVSIIQFNHDASSESRQVRHRKRLGQIKAYSLYHWGSAEELRKNYEN